MNRRIGLLPLLMTGGCCMDGNLTVTRPWPPACPPASAARACDQGRESMRYVPPPVVLSAPAPAPVEARPGPTPVDAVEPGPAVVPPELTPVAPADPPPAPPKETMRWKPLRKVRST